MRETEPLAGIQVYMFLIRRATKHPRFLLMGFWHIHSILFGSGEAVKELTAQEVSAKQEDIHLVKN